MKRFHALTASLLLLLCATAFASSSAPCHEPEPGLPTDLVDLLPGDATAMMVVASLDAADALAAELAAYGEEDDEDYRVSDMLDEVPNGRAMVDTGRPVAVLVKVPPIMFGQEPSVMMIVPLKRDWHGKDLSGIEGLEGSVRSGGYLAVNPWAGYAMPVERAPFADVLLPGTISATADFASFFDANWAMLKMGMAMGMAQPQPGPDGEMGEPAMTPDQAQQTTELLEKILLSIDRLDFAMDADGDDWTFRMFTDLEDGSALAAGPQPSFAEAMALTSLLPAGADLVSAQALDQSKQMELLMPLYTTGAGLPSGDTGFDMAAWFAEFGSARDMSTYPTATSLDFGEKGMSMVAITATPDPDTVLDVWVSMMKSYEEMGMGFSAVFGEPEMVEGVSVSTMSMDVDLARLAELEGEETPDAEEMAMIGMVMDQVMPAFRLCVVDDKVIMTTADADLAALIRNVRAGAGAPPKSVAKLAAAAGLGCQTVFYGDLSGIFDWTLALVAGFAPETELPAFDGAVPFHGWVTVDGDDFGYEMAVGKDGIDTLIGFIQAMEAMED